MAIPTRVSLALATLAFTAAAACGGDDDFSTLAPELVVMSAADPSATLCTVDENEQITSCAAAFGDVPIGEGRFLRLWLRNSINFPLTISSVTLTSADPTPQFTLAELRTVNEPADGAVVVNPSDVTTDAPIKVLGDRTLEDDAGAAYTELVVRYAPRFAASAEATITIVSDAKNVGDGATPSNPEVALELRVSGRGLDVGGADIRVEPPACNFGQVGVGVAAACEVTISNDGTRDLVIDALGFTPETPISIGPDGIFDPQGHVFGLYTTVTLPLFVAPGTATSVRLFANPDALGVSSGALTLHSNDAIEADVTVPLSVEGAEAPTAIATVKSINNVPNADPSPVVRPLDDVLLSAEQSQASVATASIVSYFWEIVPPLPTGSSVQLATPFAAETRFTFNSSGFNRSGIDVAGTYTVKLIVVDSAGRASTNNATVTLNAIPAENLHVQLTWDSPDYDYDLHVVKDDGAYCSEQSCFYFNCNVVGSGGIQPEWDGVPGTTTGDPKLDIDDLSGYGPENINIDVPIDGNYTIAVHAYSALVTTEVWATVKVYVNGALAFEEAHEMSSGLSFWEVATVEWANGGAIIFPLDSYQPSGWGCPL